MTGASEVGRSLRGRRVVVAAVGVGVVAAVLYLYLLDPAKAGFFPPCLFHKLTGLYCSGCGTTRALHQLLHGHVLEALRLNPFTMIALPIVAVVLLRRLLYWMQGRQVPARRPIRAVWIWLLLAAMVLFAAARNIPCRPFSLLAP